MERRRNALQFHYLEINTEHLILVCKIVSCEFRGPPSPSSVPSENLRTTVPQILFGLGIQVSISWLRGRRLEQKRTLRGHYSLREEAERPPRGTGELFMWLLLPEWLGRALRRLRLAIAPFREAKPKLNPSLLEYVECLLFPQLNPDHLLLFYVKPFFINMHFKNSHFIYFFALNMIINVLYHQII